MPGGIGGIGYDGETTAGDGAGYDSVANAFREVGYGAGKESDRGVIIEGGKDAGNTHGGFGSYIGETLEDGLHPPSLHPTQDEQTGQEEGYQERDLDGKGVLVLRGSHGEPEEEEEASDKDSRVMGKEDGPCQEED